MQLLSSVRAQLEGPLEAGNHNFSVLPVFQIMSSCAAAHQRHEESGQLNSARVKALPDKCDKCQKDKRV